MWLFSFIIIIVLFRKATLGFDAVVVVRGLAAATGVGFRALVLLLRLRHTPPGGEVEGHAPRPRQNPVSLHAVALQLLKGEAQVRTGGWKRTVAPAEGSPHLLSFSLELPQLVFCQRQEVVVVFWILLPPHGLQQPGEAQVESTSLLGFLVTELLRFKEQKHI